MIGAIFISYRRDDSRHAAGRLADRLLQTYPREQLFMDVDNIGLGLDFAKVLEEKVAACDVMLVMIGPDWLEARDLNGHRRLEDPHDFVRIEIETALARCIPVIPVLIDGATAPRELDLPPTLSPLSRWQATSVTHERFGSDANRVVASLEKIVPPRPGLGLSQISSSAVDTIRPITAEVIMEVASEFPPGKKFDFAPNIPEDAAKQARAAAKIPQTEPLIVVIDYNGQEPGICYVALTANGLYGVYGGIWGWPRSIPWDKFLARPIAPAMFSAARIGGTSIVCNPSTLVPFLLRLKSKALRRPVTE